MDENQVFLSNIRIEDVPWHRLVTTYGRATDFPSYFAALLGSEMAEVDKAGEQIELNIEHQSTLWPATPFAMIFLAKIFRKALSIINQDINRYIVIL